MSTNPSLTATKEPVLALIAAGFTTAAAAEKAGIHRNTVTNWLHQNDFRSALERARSDKALLYQDQAEALAAEALAAEALAALRAIIADPAVPPAVRVKAAIAMLDRAASLPPLAAVPDVQPSLPVLKCCQKNAQPSPPVQPSTPLASPLLDTKIGRNQSCPCGSGIKFKRCCLSRTGIHAAPASAA